MVNSQPIRGFVAAPFTAMHPDRSINVDLIPAYAAHLAATGVSGAFVNGTTGEGYSLTREERMATAEAWVRAASGTLRVIVHVGAESIADARALAAHAEEIGADAIASMSPVFFKPDVEGLVTYCAEIASAAPGLPFYYYHMPSMTGLFIPVVDFLSRATDRIPTLRGVKYTHYDLMDFKRCAALADGRFDLLFGRDEILLSALVLGTEGMVGSTYSYAMPLFSRLMDAWRAGRLDEASSIQERIMRMVGILERNGGGLAAGKSLMTAVGLELGPLRLPNRSLDAAAASKAITEARELGVFGGA